MNFTDGGVSDRDLQHVSRAVNQQVTEDFFPIWGSMWMLRVDAPAFVPTSVEDLDDAVPEQVRADAVIYIITESTLSGALGYHSINTVELPVGFVFTDVGSEPWSVTLSHEVLELISDPTVNILVPGPSPDPADNGKTVLHTYENCDAVERFSYEIDGVAVSDFVTPWYFSLGDAQGTRNDFLGVDVPSFGLKRRCHIAYFDLDAGWKQYVKPAKGSSKGKAPALEARRPADAALKAAVKTYNQAVDHKATIATPLPKSFNISRSGRRRAADPFHPNS